MVFYDFPWCFRSPAGPSARPQRHGALAPGRGAGAPGRGAAAAAAGRRARPGESPRADAVAPGGVEWTALGKWPGFGRCPILGDFEHHLRKYLLEMISPIFG